jgi:hypothetical protein
MDGPGGRLQYNRRETTVSKSKNTIENSSTVKAEFILGADAFKNGVEKTTKLYESVGEFNKDSLEAYIEAATVVGNSLQSIAQDSSSYAKKAIEDAIATSKAMMSSKSFGDVFELQTSFANRAFAGYASQLSRINQAFVATAKESSAPLQARVEAARELMQLAGA